MGPVADATRLRVVPLGGFGEFGLHSLLVEWGHSSLLLDAGAMFPPAEMFGVDVVVPDFSYLAAKRKGLQAIFLTHGHEDHIGALAFALRAAPAPVYGSRLTLAFAARTLRERQVEADLRPLAPGSIVEAGPFRVHAIRVAHSVLDSLALAIETPAGVVLATGDFKMSAETDDAERTDAEALAAWGRRGVLLMLSGSTNVERRGRTGAEDDVIPAFEEIFARTPGKVLVSCLSSSIPRMQRVCALARRAGRGVGFVGRRMRENTEIARELRLLSLGEADLIPSHSLSGRSPGKTALLVSGSQGEPLSALSAISLGEHRHVGVGPGDTVVLSARVIPGNERAVSRLIGRLFRCGARVVHPETAHVHVSGHGNRDDLVEMLRLVCPKYFVPIHGEYRMLAQHALLAAETGVPWPNVFVLDDGQPLSLGPDDAWRDAPVPVGRVSLDAWTASAISASIVRDRRHLSNDGIVVPVVVLDKQTGRVESPPEIVTRGFIDADEGAGLLEEAARLLVAAVEARTAEERSDPALTRERVRLELRRFLRKRTQRRPMVIPVVMEI